MANVAHTRPLLCRTFLISAVCANRHVNTDRDWPNFLFILKPSHLWQEWKCYLNVSFWLADFTMIGWPSCPLTPRQHLQLTYMAKISQKEPSQNSLILTPPDLGIFLTLRAFYFLGNFSCLNFCIQGDWSRLIDLIWGRGEIAMTEWLTEVLFKTVTSQ